MQSSIEHQPNSSSTFANSVELQRPAEWLRALEASPDGHRALIGRMGFAKASYLLATAHCLAHPLPTPVPTVRELFAAACKLSTFSGMAKPRLAQIVESCEAAGLTVIV